MTTLIAAITGLLITTSLAIAQDGAPPPLGDLKVRRVSSGSKTKTNWQTYYGSSDKDKTQHMYLEVMVRNIGQAQTQYNVVIAFLVLKPFAVKSSKNHCVYKSYKKSFELSPLETWTETVDSYVDSSRLNLVAIREEYRSGYEFSGWVAWLLVGDKILQVKGSNRQIETVAKGGVKAFTSLEETEEEP